MRRINYEDLILDLYLINKIKVRRGNLFIAKILYLFEDSLYNKNLLGPRYKMYKDNYGPYNEEIKNNLQVLYRNGFIDIISLIYRRYGTTFEVYTSNENTENFFNDIDDLISENSIIFNYFDDIIDRFGSYTGRGLMKYVYSLEKTGIKQQRIADYRYQEIILDPECIEKPTLKFELDEDWYDTIEILLDPQIKKNLEEAIRDVQQGNVITYRSSK